MQSGHSAAAVDALTAARNLLRDDPLAQARLAQEVDQNVVAVALDERVEV